MTYVAGNQSVWNRAHSRAVSSVPLRETFRQMNVLLRAVGRGHDFVRAEKWSTKYCSTNQIPASQKALHLCLIKTADETALRL